jgi:two-component system chemotaxis response regulator CheB
MNTPPTQAITVVLAEDSPTQRVLLSWILEDIGGFHLVGVAKNGREAIAQVEALHPDIVVMDCLMPEANGFEATQEIMRRCPTPIVLISATSSYGEVEHAFEAIRSGALAFAAKPADADSDVKARDDLIRTIRLMAEVKVIKRRPPAIIKAATAKAARPDSAQIAGRRIKLVAIAGSTGAPAVIGDLLKGIAGEPVVPILIVQHMAVGFVTGFAKWLSERSGIDVSVAEHGILPTAGTAYLAPDDHHMGVDSLGHVILSQSGLEEGFRPSANYLFRSVAEHFGRSAMGILLTGMGRDGAAGLGAMRRAGSLTIAQDEASCVVFGMPREAIRQNAVEKVLSPPEIAGAIRSLAKKRGV